MPTHRTMAVITNNTYGLKTFQRSCEKRKWSHTHPFYQYGQQAFI